MQQQAFFQNGITIKALEDGVSIVIRSLDGGSVLTERLSREEAYFVFPTAGQTVKVCGRAQILTPCGSMMTLDEDKSCG